MRKQNFDLLEKNHDFHEGFYGISKLNNFLENIVLYLYFEQGKLYFCSSQIFGILENLEEASKENYFGALFTTEGEIYRCVKKKNDRYYYTLDNKKRNIFNDRVRRKYNA